MASVSDALTEQQLRFVAEYVADPRSAGRAYQRAYGQKHTDGSAAQLASLLLKKVEIQDALKAARHDWCRQHRITFQATVRKLAAIAFADPSDLYEADPENGGLPKPRAWDDIPPTARKNIKKIKFKRRKLKGDKDCIYEIEELEYGVADQEWALGKLCDYLGVTKGSLTADELRAIIYGTAATTHPTTTPPGAAGIKPQPLPGSDPGGTAGAPIDPDE